MLQERLSRGSWFTGPGAALVVVCFFLPWIAVSCEGQPMITLSGLDMARAGAVGAGRSELYLVVGAGLISLLVLAYVYQRGYVDTTSAVVQLGLAVIGFVPIGLVYLDLRPEAQDATVAVTANTQLGLWATLLGLLLIAVGGVLDLMERRREPAPWPPEPLRPTEPATPPPPPPPPEPVPIPEPQPARFDPTRFMGEPPPVTAWLVQKSGGRAGKQYSLAQARNVVGRDATRCDIVLDNDTVSAEHAAVLYENEQFVLYDLASTNGTFLNQRRIQRQSLLDSDVVRFGEVALVFKAA